MRRRTYRRNQGPDRRKVIGAVVVSGVLVAAGIAGVQLASASTTPKAADVVTVDGQQFDVSQCAELEINGGQVICDGEALAPQEEQGADDAALASAQALEAQCDLFAADVAAAEGAAGAEDQNAEDQNAEEAAAAAKAANKKLATKWAKKLNAAEEAEQGAAEEGAAEDQAAEDQAAEDAAAQDAANAAAVTSAQAALLQTCLALADAKAAAGIVGDAGDQGAEPSEDPSAEPSESAATTKK